MGKLSSRDQILGRVRQALTSQTDWPEASQALLAPQPAVRDPNILWAEFAAELTALGGTCQRMPRGQAAEAISETLSAQGGAFLAWDGAHLPIPSLIPELERRGYRRVDANLAHDGPAREAQLQQLASVQVGITGVVAAIAQVGGLVVASSSNRARTASLLPPIHIALITPDQLFATLEAWLSAQGDSAAKDPVAAFGSSLTVIAGPSRTADIEQKLALGVHGPREVHVICLD